MARVAGTRPCACYGRSEQPLLYGNEGQLFALRVFQGMGVVAGGTEAVDKTFRAVRAVDDARGDALDGFEQLVVVRMIR